MAALERDGLEGFERARLVWEVRNDGGAAEEDAGVERTEGARGVRDVVREGGWVGGTDDGWGGAVEAAEGVVVGGDGWTATEEERVRAEVAQVFGVTPDMLPDAGAWPEGELARAWWERKSPWGVDLA